MLLVVAIIVIVAAMLYPPLESMYAQSQLTAGTDSFRSGLASARAQAMEEGIPYRVAYVPGMGNFRVGPDLDPFWNGGAQGDMSNDSVILEEHLPKGIVFSDSSRPMQIENQSGTFDPPEEVAADRYKTVAVFLPDGTARVVLPDGTSARDCKVLFCARGARPMWVILRCMTGEASVTPYQADGGQ
jgi:Tfp pilus assembly protein FimT